MQVAQSDTSAKAVGKLNEAAKTKDLKNIDQAAQDFEAVFISEMMKPMFEGVETDGPFGGGKGEEVFRGVMLQEYGKLMARTGSIGIAEPVKAEMIRLQEQQQMQNKMKEHIENAGNSAE